MLLSMLTMMLCTYMVLWMLQWNPTYCSTVGTVQEHELYQLQTDGLKTVVRSTAEVYKMRM